MIVLRVVKQPDGKYTCPEGKPSKRVLAVGRARALIRMGGKTGKIEVYDRINPDDGHPPDEEFRVYS